MDISTSMYSKMATQNAASEALSKVASGLKGKAVENADDAELMNACKQFESYFIEQVYKEMVNTIPKEEFTSQSTGTLVDYYKEQMVQKMAETTGEQSDLGIAQALYQQMKRTSEGEVPAAQLKASEEDNI